MSTLSEHIERRDRANAELLGLVQKHGNDVDRWPDGAVERGDNLRRAISRAEAEITRIAKREEERAEAVRSLEDGYVDQGAEQLPDPGTSRAGGGPAQNPAVQAALRHIDGQQRSGILPAHGAERLERIVRDARPGPAAFAARYVTAVGSDAYTRAFARLVADPERGHLDWTPEEADAFRTVRQVQGELRAMSLTGNAGGFLVPTHLDPTVILTNAGTINPIRAVSRVEQVLVDTWNGVSSAGVTAEWTAEGVQAADATPTLAQPSIPTFKGDAFVPFSIEVGMDAPTLMAQLGVMLTDGAERLMAAAYTTGNGTTAPAGVIKQLDGGASEVAPTTGETFAAADVYKVQNALSPRWQANARWMANLVVLNLIDQFETSNGAKQFPNVGDAMPVLLRKPVHENSDMDGTWNTGATADNFILLYGDFQQNIIVDRIGTTVELVPHLFGENGRPTGQRGAYMYFRTGSEITTIDAFRVLNLATAA